MIPAMLLRVRSGNCPTADTMNKLPDWNRTRTALLELEGRLRCSVCLSLLKEPVCLGGCEHVFCRTCVGESVGSECPVCHTPAWVKDVQINRQLDNMIQLCSKLHTLIDGGRNDGIKMDLCQDASLKQNTTEGESKRKNIKMWFSPRRGKVRYVLEREENSQQKAPLLDTYEFVSSSPTVQHAKPKAVKCRKTKKRLEDINKKWDVETQSENTQAVKENNNQESNRSVSFCNRPRVILLSDDDVQENHYECSKPIKNNQDEMGLRLENHRKEDTTETGNLKDDDGLKSETMTSGPLSYGAGQETDHSIDQKQKNIPKEISVEEQPNCEKLLQCTQLKDVSSGRHEKEKTPLKRKHYPSASPHSSATKRPRKAKVADDSKSEGDTGGLEKVRKSPKVEANPKPHSTPRTPKDGRRKSQLGTNVQTSPTNFPLTKKNHKGETMLHVASIKGEVGAVEELLKSGANPNVKDNAGWTPLHEACNHGHTNVVEVLLRHQALVNTTGYQNDSPLHDAVKNGHTAIVRLLLQHGASQDAVNIFGLRPVDYAETEEIKSVLLQTQAKKQLQSPDPTQKVVECREGTLVILASGLSASQRSDLNKLGSLLKAEICSNYNSTVTHIIVGDEPMLRTMKCMMGILSGCWILRCAWVKACLETRRRQPEEFHEVDSGPHRARLNREQLLPSLLDGCHFYFLGCFKEHRKEDLIELVKAAGGQILIRQPKPDSDVTQTINTVAYHADADSDQRFCTQYIIYDKTSKFIPGRVRQGKVWFAPSSWLIECITSFHLLPVP